MSLSLPDEDAQYSMYMTACQALECAGYKQYEISNFSKNGRRCVHNLKYWHCEDYLGFGPAAHSYFDGVRFAHSRDIDAYLKGESIIIDNEPIGANEAMNEYVMLGMRLTKGIDYSDFFTRFGVDFLQKYAKIKNYSPEFVALDAEGCCFTEKGMFVSNYVLSDILEFGE
jgi:oxygen-independent coproporphyrinogen-3 oxidase